MIIACLLAETLDELEERTALAVRQFVGQLGSGITGPATRELVVGQSLEPTPEFGCQGHGHEQVEAGVLVELVDEFGSEMLGIGQDEPVLDLRTTDGSGEFEQLGSGR